MQFIQGMIMILLGLSMVPVSEAASDDPLFLDQSTLNVEITAPVSTLIRERSEDEELPGVLSFMDADGTWVQLDLQVRARGNFRHRNCDFPPLSLNFRRSQVEGTLFDGQNKLKLVVHCKDSGRYQQTVLREYFAYRLLNAVTGLSFRVRLLKVAYEDSDERRSRMARYAFLIEHPNRLAARIDRQRLDIERADISSIEPEHLNLTSVFQYLIGNVDFSPVAGSNNECCHNYEMFENGAGSVMAIPYDFDLAGIVNAPYAEPDKELGVERLGQRVYRGYCGNNSYVEGSISKFIEARDSVYALLAEQQEMEPSVRANITSYIDEFYEILDDPEAVERELMGECKNEL